MENKTTNKLKQFLNGLFRRNAYIDLSKTSQLNKRGIKVIY